MHHFNDDIDELVQEALLVSHFKRDRKEELRTSLVLGISTVEYEVHGLEGTHGGDGEVDNFYRVWEVGVPKGEIEKALFLCVALGVVDEELLVPDGMAIVLDGLGEVHFHSFRGGSFICGEAEFYETTRQARGCFPMQGQVNGTSNIDPHSPSEAHKRIRSGKGMENFIVLARLFVV